MSSAETLDKKRERRQYLKSPKYNRIGFKNEKVRAPDLIIGACLRRHALAARWVQVPQLNGSCTASRSSAGFSSGRTRYDTLPATVNQHSARVHRWLCPSCLGRAKVSLCHHRAAFSERAGCTPKTLISSLVRGVPRLSKALGSMRSGVRSYRAHLGLADNQ